MNTTVGETKSEVEEHVGRAVAERSLMLRLRGRMTAATAPKLRKLIRQYARSPQPRLILDLQGVTLIDVTGIAALVEASTVIEDGAGGEMLLRLNPTVGRALKGSGTIAAFRLYDDRNA
jgi:anti-anti-sigma factor